MKDIGKRIRELRESKSMTQQQLAEMVGYKSRVSINKIELQRDVPLNKLAPIAKALGVEPSVLAGWEEEPSPKELLVNAYIKNAENEEIRKKAVLILAYLSQLNDEGIAEAEKRISELTELSKYQKAN